MLERILNQHLKASDYLTLFILGILYASACGAWLKVVIIYITDPVLLVT